MALHCGNMQDTYSIVIDMGRVGPVGEEEGYEL